VKKPTRIGTILAAIVCVLVFCAGVPAQKNSQQEILLQRAIQKETVDGDLAGAIKLYKDILANPGGNRAVAARALLHLGQCNEKLGNAEARKAYEQLVREYGDQTEVVAEARTRLAALAGTAGAAGGSTMAVRRVWAGQGAVSDGSPSADGRYLATIDSSTGDVAIRNLGTGDMRRVTKTGGSGEFGMSPLFSPDERQIAFAWWVTKASTFDLDLRVVGVDGGGARTVFHEDGTWTVPGAWMPDGKQVLVMVGRTRKEPVHLGLISVADGTLRILVSMTGAALPDKLSVSPDGRYLLYDRRQADGQRDIFLFALQDRRETRLVEHLADDGVPIWQPDGKGILFASDRTGSPGLWAMAVAEGKPIAPPTLVKQDIGPGFVPMGFSRNGALYYGLKTGMLDIHVGTLDLAAGRVLEPPAPISQRVVGANRAPSWSPDGKYLAYVSRRGMAMSRSETITIRAVDTGREHDIPVGPITIRELGWFPDASALVAQGRDEQEEGAIFRIDVKSGTVTTLVRSEEKTPILHAAVTPDGKSLVYLVSGGVWSQAVVVRDLQTGRKNEITPPSLFATGAAVSQDGQRVAAFVADQKSGSQAVAVVPIAGGEPREICRYNKVNALVGQPAWSPDGRTILFGARPQGKVEFWSVSSEGGEPQRFSLPLDSITDFSVHPDGKRVAFAAGQSQTEVWVIENFLPKPAVAQNAKAK
jgi:Tol biopolymer transport system component